MRTGPGSIVLGAVLVTFVITAAAPFEPDPGPRSGVPSLACDKAYFFSPQGTYLGSQCFDYPGADGSRFACIPGGDCSFCGACHTPAQRDDKAWLLRTDMRKHRDIYFPKQSVPLRTGTKLAWGTGAHLRLQGSAMTITANDGKDLATFPPGSLMLHDGRGTTKLILLPRDQELTLIR